jgi:HlyD family secretion protein
LIVFVLLAMRQGQRGGVSVRTEAAQRRDLVAVVTASGRIRPHRKADIQADVSGRIVELRVREGDTVQVNDTLLVIDPRTWQAAVARAQAAQASAEASLAQARANRDQSERSLERTRAIHAQNAQLISDQEMEAAETNFEVQDALLRAAEHSVAQARAVLQESRDQLAKTVIRSPMSGVITRRNVEQGETAIVGTMNNPGTVLLTVADLSEMEAVVEVDETDVPDIALGDSASVEIDAFADTLFTGRVTEIAQSSIQGASRSLSGTTSSQAVDFEVVIRLDNPPATLRTDLSATADVVTEKRDSVLSIPIIALTLRPPEVEPDTAGGDRPEQSIPLLEEKSKDVEGVYVVGEDNVVTFRPVKVGIAGREHFEVLEGLSEGDVIVAGSYQAIRNLKDGDRVKPMEGEGQRGEASTNNNQSDRVR